MTRLLLHIPGVPVGKGRPRATRSGRMYTPAKTRAYEAQVAAEARRVAKGVTLDGPVRLQVAAYFPRPKRLQGPKHPQEAVYAPKCRVDLDNICKGICDGLQNGGAISNDSRVVELVASKWWVAQGDSPCVVVEVVAL